MDKLRYQNAAMLVGIQIPPDTTLSTMRAIVAQREKSDAATQVATPARAVAKPILDENVFRTNETDRCPEASPEEITARWNFVKQVSLHPQDMAVHVDLLDEKYQMTLMTNGWYVVVKEIDCWHFRRDTINPADTANQREQLREEQDTAYAIAQVEDYKREEKEIAKEAKEETTSTKVPSAVGDDNHAYKRRLVDALVMFDHIPIPDAHAFSNMVFNTSSPCSKEEKRRFASFWKTLNAPPVKAPRVKASFADAPPFTAEEGDTPLVAEKKDTSGISSAGGAVAHKTEGATAILTEAA